MNFDFDAIDFNGDFTPRLSLRAFVFRSGFRVHNGCCDSR